MLRAPLPLSALVRECAVLAVGLTSLAGCAGSSADHAPVDPTKALESPPGGPDSDPVRAAFISRTSLDTCGKVVLGQGQSLRPTDQTYRCLDAARTGRKGAELTVAVPTTEGDPIVHYVRVLPDGSIEVYADPTHDQFAGQNPTWSHTTCPAAESLAACVPQIFAG
jgi:hypothetical protein